MVLERGLKRVDSQSGTLQVQGYTGKKLLV